MCQLICKPQGAVLTKATLQRAWNENPHGAGFSFEKEGIIYYHKGFFHFKEFWKAYQAEARSQNALVHFRYATHGEHSAENCHPFALGHNLTAAHNGVLSRFLPSGKDNRSDSRLFFEDYLGPVMKNTDNPAVTLDHIRPLIEKVIGGSKIAILGLHGFTIYNERLGEWHDGAWYSAGYPEEYPRLGFARSGYGYSYGYGENDVSYWEREYYDTYAYEKKECCAYCDRPTDSMVHLGTERLCEQCYDVLST